LSGRQNHKDGVGFYLKHRFKTGDLVSWKYLSGTQKYYGVVKEIILRQFFHDRNFYMAVIVTPSGDEKEINVGMLKLESHSK
jgi:hypothetical protein|tara:strand:+ start:606 stop:851 length:246 start_codon:yes stop_codon:yes gene_type:complete